MSRTGADGRTPANRGVPQRSRPTEARAAAASRVAGGAGRSEELRRRIAEAHRRMEEEAARPRLTRLAAKRPAGPSRSPEPRPTRPAPGRARAIANPSGAGAMYAAAGLAAARAEPFTQTEEDTRPRHLKVVPPGTLSAAQRRRRARAALMATLGAVSVIAFALVYLHVVLAQRQFQIDRLNSEVGKAQTSYQNLRLHVAQLGSPQHVISTAEGQLGMVQPSKVVYLTPNRAATTGSATAPNGSGSPSAGSAGTAARASGTGSASQGAANWPQIKSQPAGTP